MNLGGTAGLGVLATVNLSLNVFELVLAIATVASAGVAWSNLEFRSAYGRDHIPLWAFDSAALIVAVLLTIHAIPHRLRLFSRLSNPPRLPFRLALRGGFNIAQFVFWVACVAQLRTTPWNYLSNSNNVVTAYQAAEGLAITAMVFALVSVALVAWEEIWIARVRGEATGTAAFSRNKGGPVAVPYVQQMPPPQPAYGHQQPQYAQPNYGRPAYPMQPPPPPHQQPRAESQYAMPDDPKYGYFGGSASSQDTGVVQK